MATTLQCQPSTGEANQYLVITTRILAAVGFSYLLKRLYQSIMHSTFSHRSLSGTGGDDTAAEANIGITSGHAPLDRINLELDFDDYSIDGGDLGIRMPEPAYHPRGSL